ncbi:PTS transporter subunit EIIA [Propioniciclava coleopterorum]|uniref:PTS transporter subunit EIIA n=1 Tax=Propioniciclava coleopterorum TaxID=2714937 RepID=A0A6G7YAN9_9ACTN|nr:PTS sugar transporter subunit IIA [Propioniciclava coleopterorum]QIK73677.1 PTS transporter subunit EIIA [Propioniciclava coleopterorum]
MRVGVDVAWLSERQALLLHLLSEVGHPVTGQGLTTLLGVSPRTLRYDIARVNRTAGVDLVQGTSQGYRLDLAAHQSLTQAGVHLTPELGNEDRVLLYLLDHPRTDVHDIVVDCYLGESVVRSALRKLKAQLGNGPTTLSTRGSAVSLDADELELRRLLGQLVHRAMDVAGGRNSRIGRYLPDVDVPRLGVLVDAVLAEHGVSMDDLRRESLVITLAICLQRSRRRSPQPGGRDLGEDAASRIVAALTTQAARLYPERPLGLADQAHLAGLVASALDADDERPSPAGRPDAATVRCVVHDALEETVARFNLTIQRDKLLSSLEGHIGRMLRRVDTMLYFRNSLQDSLHARSPFLYDVAVFLADRIARRLDVRFTDDEIGLLAIYFGLYSTEPTTDEQAVTAVLVCPRYQTLQDWLIAGLVERYLETLRIVDIVSTPAEADALEADLVITTFEDSGNGRPTVQISAVLSHLDVQAIDAALSRVRESRSRGRMARTMARFLDPALFFTGQRFDDATEAIVFLSRAMAERGVVPPEYLDSVLLRETYSSTAFARRFAIPHAMDLIAHETKVAVLIPEAPISWEGADVTLVLMLAINGDDYDDFIDFYQPLVRLLYDPQLFSQVRKASGFAEFRDLLGEQLSAE